MYVQSERLTQGILAHNSSIENYNTGNNIPSRKQLVNDEDESKYFRNSDIHCKQLTNQDFVRDDVEKIIKKYKYGNIDINNFEYTRLNNNPLIKKNVECAYSHQNFHSYYISPRCKTYSFKTDTSMIDRNAKKCKRKLEKKIAPKATFKECNNLIHKNRNCSLETRLTSNETLNADKMTYCRPIQNLYNEQFIYKTMERNSRLKRLVKKFAIARQRQKENISWNNFINELKNKHACESSHQTQQSQSDHEQYITSDTIDDYYNKRFSWQQSRLCRNLLKDIYAESQPTCSNRRQAYENNKSHSNRNFFPYHTDPYCYPTSSQGRIIMLERERQKNEYLKNSLSSNTENFEILVDQKQYSLRPTDILRNKNYLEKCLNTSVQTNTTIFPEFNEEHCRNKATNKIGYITQHKLIQTLENIKDFKENNQVENDMKNISLVNIENKLESLVYFINNYVDEIKSKRKTERKNKYAYVNCETNNRINKKVSVIKSDTIRSIGVARTDKLICGVSNGSSESSDIIVSNFFPTTFQKALKGNDQLLEMNEINSSKEAFETKPCSVHITFSVPTKDCSTEVTKSLLKQNMRDKAESIEEIRNTDPIPLQQMTIAVNTDPFSFLSLLKISTEVVKHFLSYMPNIDYYSYLSMLHFPQITRNSESLYTCNVCGAAFNKPSKLSDHIQEHNLGKTRDCCVCRHVIDMCKRYPGLFRCNFCGQRFTRAYCCELHQQSCARRTGRKHDVSSSLMLLR